MIPSHANNHKIRMKKLLTIAVGICLLGVLTPAVTQAKGKKNKAATENPLAKFDTNKDGKLSDDEITALKKDYADNKTEALKKYDTNSNNKIDDSEVDAIKTDFAAAKHHKKKKNQ